MSERRMFQAAEYEDKRTQAGKPYLRVKAAGIGWATVWGDTDSKLLKDNPNGTFEGDVETNEKGFTNISGVVLAAEGSTSASQGAGASQMTKDDWNAKEAREAFRIAWAVVYRAERDNGTEPELAMSRGLEYAQLLNSATWKANEDVPF